MHSLARDWRKLVPVKTIVFLAVVALCLLELNSIGQKFLQQSLGDIYNASEQGKPFVDLYNPVTPWERELYEKRMLKGLTIPELGLELSRTWNISPLEKDVVAWIARMKIYANFLDIFGFLLYFPGPMWFRVLWELYGETALLLITIVFVASRTKNIHLRYAAVIAIAGLAVLNNLISAPARHSVLGGDITVVPAAWNFHEWYLRESIVKWQEIPLWYRYRYAGAPYLGDPQMIVFYPSTIILALAPNEMVGIRYAIVLHVIMSGVTMYFLLNVWGQKPEASLVGGIGYMLGGYTFAKIWAGHLTFTYPYAWIPLVLAFLELSLRRRSVKYAALAGLSLAMEAQSGLIMALYTGILLALYGLYNVGITLTRHTGKTRELLRHAREATKVSVVFTVFTVLVSASKILPTLEVLPYLDRGAPLTEKELLRGVIPDLNQLIQVFTFRPRGLENPDWDFPAWGVGPFPYNWAEYWSYAGVLLPLAICGLRFVRRNKVVILLAATMVLSALWSMGTFYTPFIQTVPFLTFTRVPSRLLVLAQFAFAGLAATTVTNVQAWLANKADSSHRILRRLKPDKVFALLVVIIVFTDLATAGVGLVRTMDVMSDFTLGAVHRFGPTTTSAMEYMMQDSVGGPFRVYTVNPPNVYAYSINGLETTSLSSHPDLRFPSWDFSINAYSRYHQFAQKSRSYKMMGMLNVKYVIADTPQETGHELELVRSYREEEFLYSNRYYMNRIEYVEHGLLIVCPDDSLWESVATDTIFRQAFDPTGLSIIRGRYLDEFTLDDLKRFSAIQIADESGIPANNPNRAVELLEEYANDGGFVIWTTGTVPDSLLGKLGSKSGTAEVNITRYTPNSLEATVTAENRGFALISETYIPGWRVYVSGREAKVLQVNDIFIGLPLDAGTNSLRVVFKPQNYDLGVASAILGFVGVIALLLTRQIKAVLRKLSGPTHLKEIRVQKSQTNVTRSASCTRHLLLEA